MNASIIARRLAISRGARRWRYPGLALAVIVASALAVNAQAAPDCSDPDKGQRIKCQTDGLLDAAESSVDEAIAMGILTEKQKTNLKNSLERGRKHSARTGGAGFKGLARKTEVGCALKQLSLAAAIDYGVTGHPQWKGEGDADGVCDTSPGSKESCEEILGDQLGDDDGLCWPRTGKKKEACVQLCDSEALVANDDNFDDERSEDIQVAILEATEATEAAAASLAQAAGVLRTMELLRASAQGVDACTILPGTRTPLPDGLRYSVVAARGVANISDKFCNQDAVGFNGASACAVFETILYTVEQVLEAIDDKNNEVTTQTIDLTRDCVEQIAKDVGETKAEVLEVKRLVQKTIRLLRTPQGRREGFPDKSPDEAT